MLDQSVERDSEEASEETQEPEIGNTQAHDGDEKCGGAFGEEYAGVRGG